MLQHVMPHLVSCHIHNLRRVHLRDRRVPHHNSFRRAESRHIRIQLRRLLPRSHPEHPLRWNRFPRPLHHLFQFRRQPRILHLQRLKRVEHGVNHHRLNKHQQQNQRNHRQPEIKPPSRRRFPDHPVQNPHHNHRSNHRKQFALGPIPQPRSPSLHRQSVCSIQPVVVNPHRQFHCTHRQRNQRRKNQHLYKSPQAHAFRHVPILRRHLPPQNHQQHRKPVHQLHHPSTQSHLRQRPCLRLPLRRQGVL